MSEARTFRPSLSREELEALVKAVYFRKKHLEQIFSSGNHKPQTELEHLGRVFAHFCDLLKGKVKGRRKALSGYELWTDGSLAYFGVLDKETLAKVKGSIEGECT